MAATNRSQFLRDTVYAIVGTTAGLTPVYQWRSNMQQTAFPHYHIMLGEDRWEYGDDTEGGTFREGTVDFALFAFLRPTVAMIDDDSVLIACDELIDAIEQAFVSDTAQYTFANDTYRVAVLHVEPNSSARAVNYTDTTGEVMIEGEIRYVQVAI
jgi:hypothetical protein